MNYKRNKNSFLEKCTEIYFYFLVLIVIILSIVKSFKIIIFLFYKISEILMVIKSKKNTVMNY